MPQRKIMQGAMAVLRKSKLKVRDYSALFNSSSYAERTAFLIISLVSVLIG